MKRNYIKLKTFLAGIILVGSVVFPSFSLAKDKIEILPANVPILVYHSISIDNKNISLKNQQFFVEQKMFEKQILYLKEKGYDIISFGTLVDHISKSLPFDKKSVVFTFDDGDENQYLNAFPILKKHGVTATFFIYTNPIGRNKHFMTWEQVIELDKAGMTIADHTKYHPFLKKITDPKVLINEIVDSKNIIEKKLGKKVLFFAYPFYQTSPDSIALLKKSGYTAARGGYYKNSNTIDRLFEMRAMEPNNNFKQFSSIFK